MGKLEKERQGVVEDCPGVVPHPRTAGGSPPAHVWRNRATGPISFLAGSAAVGVAMTLLALYSPSYAVTVNGETVGVVADASVVDEAIANVESTGSSILGYDYHVQATWSMNSPSPCVHLLLGAGYPELLLHPAGRSQR